MLLVADLIEYLLSLPAQGNLNQEGRVLRA